MVGIARGPKEFSPSDLAAELGFRALSSIQDPLRDLEESGLITRRPKAANRVRYQRNKSRGWAWAEELAASIE